MSPRSFVLLAWAAALAVASVLGVGGPAPTTPVDRIAAAPLAAPDNSIVFQSFVSGLSSPVLVTHAGDGSGRLFVPELGGRIRVIKNGALLPTPFLDITSLVQSGGEQGLLGLAFHPNYESNGRFFVFYTAKPPAPPTTNVGSNTLQEYVVSAQNPDVAQATAVRTLLSLPDRYTNHNGGMIAFGPDGFLYVGTGDEGSGGDPEENAQNPGSFFGKMLRLDVNTTSAGKNYGIPSTNPFVNNASYLPEIWALGFRNPWRWSFDRGTGAIFVGDVGQGGWEEVDLLPAGTGGLNLGWDDREGAHCFEPTTGCLTAGRTDPILEYSRTANAGPCASITGGYRYRGSLYPSLQGTYLYADYCSGRVWKGVVDGGSPTGWTAVEALQHAQFTIAGFGEDEGGELYVASFAGEILKIAAAPPTPTPTFTPTATKTPTPTLTPTATPLPCTVRPNVSVQTTRQTSNLIQVRVTSSNSVSISNNALLRIAFTRLTNAQVTAGNQVNRTTPFTVTLPANTTTTTFQIRRGNTALPMHVDFTVTDRCGAWQTFAGAGTGI